MIGSRRSIHSVACGIAIAMLMAGLATAQPPERLYPLRRASPVPSAQPGTGPGLPPAAPVPPGQPVPPSPTPPLPNPPLPGQLGVGVQPIPSPRFNFKIGAGTPTKDLLPRLQS